MKKNIIMGFALLWISNTVIASQSSISDVNGGDKPKSALKPLSQAPSPIFTRPPSLLNALLKDQDETIPKIFVKTKRNSIVCFSGIAQNDDDESDNKVSDDETSDNELKEDNSADILKNFASVRKFARLYSGKRHSIATTDNATCYLKTDCPDPLMTFVRRKSLSVSIDQQNKSLCPNFYKNDYTRTTQEKLRTTDLEGSQYSARMASQTVKGILSPNFFDNTNHDSAPVQFKMIIVDHDDSRVVNLAARRASLNILNGNLKNSRGPTQNHTPAEPDNKSETQSNVSTATENKSEVQNSSDSNTAHTAATMPTTSEPVALGNTLKNTAEIIVEEKKAEFTNEAKKIFNIENLHSSDSWHEVEKAYAPHFVSNNNFKEHITAYLKAKAIKNNEPINQALINAQISRLLEDEIFSKTLMNPMDYIKRACHALYGPMPPHGNPKMQYHFRCLLSASMFIQDDSMSSIDDSIKLFAHNADDLQSIADQFSAASFQQVNAIVQRFWTPAHYERFWQNDPELAYRFQKLMANGYPCSDCLNKEKSSDIYIKIAEEQVNKMAETPKKKNESVNMSCPFKNSVKSKSLTSSQERCLKML